MSLSRRKAFSTANLGDRASWCQEWRCVSKKWSGLEAKAFQQMNLSEKRDTSQPNQASVLAGRPKMNLSMWRVEIRYPSGLLIRRRKASRWRFNSAGSIWSWDSSVKSWQMEGQVVSSTQDVTRRRRRKKKKKKNTNNNNCLELGTQLWAKCFDLTKRGTVFLYGTQSHGCSNLVSDPLHLSIRSSFSNRAHQHRASPIRHHWNWPEQRRLRLRSGGRWRCPGRCEARLKQVKKHRWQTNAKR